MTHAFEMIETNGVTIRVAVEGEGPLIVLVHGFPESWYSWRHQIPALAAAGFRVAAMDVRGYGGSSKPHAVEAYDMQSLTGDVAGVITALSPNEKAIVIGHDWGAPIAWTTALLHPDKVRAVACLSVPWTGHGPTPFIDIARELFTNRGRFFYQIYFQDEGVAEAEFEADLNKTLRQFYFMASGDGPLDWMHGDRAHGEKLLTNAPAPNPFPPWMSEEDIAYFVQQFENSGLRGPLNRYRNWHRDHAFMSQRTDFVIRQPALFVAGERDAVLAMGGLDLMALMKPNVPDLRGAHIIPAIGHWTQQEAPEETTGYLIDWLATL